MVELGNFLNNTLQGRMVCVLAICLAVYITATRKGSLEDQIKRLSSIAFYSHERYSPSVTIDPVRAVKVWFWLYGDCYWFYTSSRNGRD